MPNQSSAKAEPLESLALSFASIAQSFREYVELYRGNSDREAAKNKRPSIVSVSRATYQRNENPETQAEVPGMRISGKIPGFNEKELIESVKKLRPKFDPRTKQTQ